MPNLGLGTTTSAALAGLRSFGNGTLLPVCESPDWPAVGTGTDAGRFTRKPHVVAPGGARTFQLVYANIGSAGAPGLNPIMVKASLTIATNVHVPVVFRAADSNGYITIAPGSFVVSEPIVASVAAAATVYSNTNVKPASGFSNYPLGRSLYSTYLDSHLTANTATDFTSGTWPTSDASGNGYGPVTIIGEQLNTATNSRRICVGIWGDSLLQGTGDLATAAYGDGGGWAVQSVRSVWPHVNTAIGGGVGGSFVQPLSRRLHMENFAGCTHLLCDFPGVNDLNNGSVTLAGLQATTATLAQACADLGIKFVGATIAPYMSSTDSFATLANQTPLQTSMGPEGGSGSIMTQYNNWLKAMPANVTAVIDAASAVTTYNAGTDRIVWRVGMTADGVHPTTAGHAAIAALATPVVAAFT